MNNNPPLGQLITADTLATRDCVHIAIIPLIAASGAHLFAGHPFRLNEAGLAQPCSASDGIGVTDPFLQTSVRPGEQFWGLLYPGSVTNLRHNWDHHALPPATTAAPEAAERTITIEKPKDPEIARLREYAKLKGPSIDDIIEEADQNLNAGCRGCY